MSNRFQINIEARDKFSKVFRDLNNKASRAVRPLTSMGRQFSAVSKEMRLDKAAAGIERLSSGASALTRNLGLSLGPLESLFSVGRAGGLIGGLAVAGGAAVALAARFGSSGFEIMRTAQNLNVSTDFLQRYRGAAKQAGVSSEALDGAIRGLGDALYHGLYDGDVKVQSALAYLGISLKKNVDGSINLEDALMGVSRAMAAYSDPMARRRIAEVFNIPEDAIPLLQRGQKGIQDLAQETAKLGDVAGPKALAWANDFETSLNRLKVALEGVAQRAGANLIPKMPGWIDAATKAISPSATDTPPAPTRYPRGASKPPPGIFDDVISWWQAFDARMDAASPRSGHYGHATPAAVGASAAAASASAPGATSPAAPPGPVTLFDVATRRLTGPRDIALERAAFQQGQASSHQSVTVDVTFQNAPPGMRTKTTSSGADVQTRIGRTMGDGGVQ